MFLLYRPIVRLPEPLSLPAGVLDPVLAALVDRALDRARIDTAAASSFAAASAGNAPRAPLRPLISRDEFCALLARVLEDVGGGPSIYALAHRYSRAFDDPAAAAAGAAPPDADAAESTFQPRINKKSAEIVAALRSREAAAAAGSQPDPLQPPLLLFPSQQQQVDCETHAAGPHERLHRTAAEHEARRMRLAVQAAREELQGLPSEPGQRLRVPSVALRGSGGDNSSSGLSPKSIGAASLTSSAHYAGGGVGDSATLAGLVRKNEDLVAHARQVRGCG